MECPSCGALLESGIKQCNECAASVGDENANSATASSKSTPSAEQQQPSKLIEFPGVSRSTVPQWRKELSERVRVAQEKRAREEALEENLAERNEVATDSTPQLELLPQAEAAPVNPLVAAALRRIERAHDASAYVRVAGNMGGATAVAYAAPMDFRGESQSQLATEFAPPTSCEFEEVESRQPEKVHLVVVPAPTVQAESTQSAETFKPALKPKPKRMIGDINDPALNYLDSVPTTVLLETRNHSRASLFARLFSAVVDLIVVSLLCAPFAALLELTNINWEEPRVWIFSAAVFSVVGFLYFTISTALTGRTLGLRLMSLRVVDARTGLIPTGTQSAGRALIYLASLLILGITSVAALLNSERLTPHDRITRTAVIHA